MHPVYCKQTINIPYIEKKMMSYEFPTINRIELGGLSQMKSFAFTWGYSLKCAIKSIVQYKIIN
jgi:hypothetical protein